MRRRLITGQSTEKTSQTWRWSWHRHVRVIGVLTILSRLLGLIRDMAMAALFGNGVLLDAFTLAFRLPNLARRLFGEGALTTAFLPEFRQQYQNDPQSAWGFARNMLWLLILILIPLVVVMIGVVWWSRGFLSESWQEDPLFWMLCWLIPYVIPICLAAQCCAILHALEEFTVPALVPIILNLIWIMTIVFAFNFVAESEGQIWWIIMGILIGGLFQLLFPLWFVMKQGFSFLKSGNTHWDQSLKVFRNLGPVLIGLSVLQLNTLADGALAWWYSHADEDQLVSAGTAAALYFGQRMYQFPLGVFGVALGTVLYSRLTEHAQQNQREDFQKDLADGFRLTMVIGIPASFGLIMISYPLTELLFQRGAFDDQDTLQTSHVVAAYACGIWAYLSISLFHRACYASGDFHTPMKVGLVSVAINLIGNLLLIRLWGGTGLALATAFTASLQMLMLYRILNRRQHRFGVTYRQLAVITTGTGLIVLCCLAGRWVDGQLNSGIVRASILVLTILSAFLCYRYFLIGMKIDDLEKLIHARRLK